MTNPMSLLGKKILAVGGGSSLDLAIVNTLQELGAELYVVEDSTAVTGGVTFDGLFWGCVHSDFRPLKMVSRENMEEIMKDNYFAFIDLLRDLMKRKAIAKNASIVVMSSISSIRAMKAKMVFSAAKAALDASVRSLSLELAPKGIRINSIQKGAVDVDFEKGHIQVVNSLNEDMSGRQVLGLTAASEVANLVAFLLSDATQTMTGTSIVIDGGYTL